MLWWFSLKCHSLGQLQLNTAHRKSIFICLHSGSSIPWKFLRLAKSAFIILWIRSCVIDLDSWLQMWISWYTNISNTALVDSLINSWRVGLKSTRICFSAKWHCFISGVEHIIYRCADLLTKTFCIVSRFGRKCQGYQLHWTLGIPYNNVWPQRQHMHLLWFKYTCYMNISHHDLTRVGSFESDTQTNCVELRCVPLHPKPSTIVHILIKSSVKVWHSKIQNIQFFFLQSDIVLSLVWKNILFSEYMDLVPKALSKYSY